MALRHGVGLPVRAWRCAWGPHATASPPAGGGLPCPSSSFIQPDADPWLRLNPPDPDHLVNRNTIPTALWAPYLGLAADRRCWLGGAGGVAPHDATSAGLLVAAFLASKLGSPADWTGIPNEQEIYLLSVSGEAHEYVRAKAGVPQPPAPPPPPPPVEPPPQPPGEPQPSDELERRVAEVEAVVLGQQRVLSSHETWISGPNTLNRHPDFVGLVEIFKRRVEALEVWRLEDIGVWRLAVERRIQALERGQPQPPPVPPPQPPTPPPDDRPWVTAANRPGLFFVGTASEPSLTINVARLPADVVGVRIRYSVRIPSDFDPTRRRAQFHSCTWNGRGRVDRGGGVVGFLALNKAWNKGLFRAGDAWDPAEGPFSAAVFALQPVPTYFVGHELSMEDGFNAVVIRGPGGGEAGRAEGFVPTTPGHNRKSLQLVFGYPNDENPEEQLSIGWQFSDLLVEVR